MDTRERLVESACRRYVLAQLRLRVHPRRLTCTWTLEASQALLCYHGLTDGTFPWVAPVRWWQVWRWWEYRTIAYQRSREYEMELITALSLPCS